MRYQGKGQAKKALLVRLPVDLKNQLDIASQLQGISQSRLAVDLISQGLNQVVSLEALLEDVAPDAAPDDDSNRGIEDWLKRI